MKKHSEVFDSSVGERGAFHSMEQIQNKDEMLLERNASQDEFVSSFFSASINQHNKTDRRALQSILGRTFCLPANSKQQV